MINKSLIFLKDKINSYLNSELQSEVSDLLEICPLKNSQGQPFSQKLGLTLVAIEREKAIPSGYEYKELETNQVFRQSKPLCLNLKILLSANFDKNYEDALKYLGMVITFFHKNSVFTHENSPILDESIQKLIIEIDLNSTEEAFHFWSMSGISYLPSIIYKVRMLIFDIEGNSLPKKTI